MEILCTINLEIRDFLPIFAVRKTIKDMVLDACKGKIERDRKRGIINRPVRAMVVGIPNVGKSTFINSYA